MAIVNLSQESLFSQDNRGGLRQFNHKAKERFLKQNPGMRAFIEGLHAKVLKQA